MPWSACANWFSSPRRVPQSLQRARSRCRRCRANCWKKWDASSSRKHSAISGSKRRRNHVPWQRARNRRRSMAKDVQIVGFRVGNETFGVPIGLVHEIVRVPEITAVPEAPGCVEGVINLRGKIISVLDLRKRFREKQITANRKNRILVVEVGGKMVGLIVD